MSKLKKILVVDDEPDAIEFINSVLTDIDNFELMSAPDGSTGITKALSENPDLIILDVIMPGTDGFHVFYELRKNSKTKDIPIIMLTGVADKVGISFMKDDMKNYLGSEPVDYIEKPLDPERLKNTVKEVFNLQNKL